VEVTDTVLIPSYVQFAELNHLVLQSFSYTFKDESPFFYLSTDSLFSDNFLILISREDSKAFSAKPRLERIPLGDISVAHLVDVAVRATPEGAGGGSYDSIASGNNFFRNTMTGFIPATGIKANSNEAYTFSGNSYTLKRGDSPEETGIYGVAGTSTTQWTIHPTNLVTLAGGPIHGNIFISHGFYETYNFQGSGTTNIESVSVRSWDNGADTTAWKKIAPWTAIDNILNNYFENILFVDNVISITKNDLISQPIDD
jgi:hypothetical protein